MKIGTGKIDITPSPGQIGMLGYGISNHIVKDIHTRLFTRAFYIEPKNKDQPPVAIAVSEIAFITPSIKKRVLEIMDAKYPEIGMTDARLMLSAEHTHSAPGGYSYHPFYNVTTPGFKPDVLDLYAKGMADAVALAHKNRTEGSIRIGYGHMEAEKQVSFNRSLKAYNQNKDVDPLTEDDRHLAVNRMMTMLQFRDADEKLLGSLNWFAVHTTSMPNTCYKVHSDNKGYAALYLEEYHRENKDYVAAFAQGNSGDVTPNFVYDKNKEHNRYWNGPYKDHDRNTHFNGRMQYKKAREIEEASSATKPLSDQTDCALQWKDMRFLEIAPEFTGGVEGAITSPSCLGMDMFVGTFTDGLGFPDALVPASRSLCKGVRAYEENIGSFFNNDRSAAQIRKYKAQGVKDILLETGENRMFGTGDIKNFVMPGAVDKTIQWMKYFAKKGAFDVIAMTPQVLPYQIMRIGELAIVAIPFEITTVAGNRLQSILESQLLGDGIEHVILSPYSNAYNGYVTTHEEYNVQMYEGGHTVFGQWSLAAIQQICHNICQEFQKEPAERKLPSDELPMPNPADLEKLMY
ncbi:MAG: hypothetical protein GY751_10845 [Bacteroidetes bacterium]|nr:hypothetical protein [Bacteroidota bacterium]